MERVREELRARLFLDDEALSAVRGDRHDELRIAYRFMVPVVLDQDIIHQGVECVGPGQRLYRVTIKSEEIELGRSFEDVVITALGRLQIG